MRRLDEKGVSPVIGVILMVAITVILAAVIASFVFGMGTRIEPVKTPGFTVKRVNATTVEITLTSFGGATNITDCDVQYTSGNEDWDFNSVGTTHSVNIPEGNRLLMTCKVDGKSQVVLDTTV